MREGGGNLGMREACTPGRGADAESTREGQDGGRGRHARRGRDVKGRIEMRAPSYDSLEYIILYMYEYIAINLSALYLHLVGPCQLFSLQNKLGRRITQKNNL
jgi:hypothetical protein